MKLMKFANGDAMPLVGLGTWKPGPDDTYRAVKAAIAAGYRHVDCAPIYGNEASIGQALAEVLSAGELSRGDLWVTSKLWSNAHRPADVLPALRRTLADLQLDYVDLYLVHWPIALRRDRYFAQDATDLVPPEETRLADTWAALEAAVELGLCRHVGVANFSATRLRALHAVARIKPEHNQVELHPYLQQPALVTACRELGVSMTAYSPLGSPDRPPALRAPDEPVLLRDPTIVDIAARHGASAAQVLIAWALQRGTAAIPKSTDPIHLRENLASVTITLTEEDRRRIAGLDRSRRYLSGAFWTVGGLYTLADIWNE